MERKEETSGIHGEVGAGKSKLEHASPPGTWRVADRSPLRLRHPFGDGQPETRPASGPAFASGHLNEGFEDPISDLRRNPGTGIGDPEYQGIAFSAYRDFNRLFRRRMAKSVLEEIREGPQPLREVEAPQGNGPVLRKPNLNSLLSAHPPQLCESRPQEIFCGVEFGVNRKSPDSYPG